MPNGIKATDKELAGARLYIRKPMPIQAQQIDQTFWIPSTTQSCYHQGKEGDYLIKGKYGELSICDKELFEETYELFNK